jgi:hypothetical protein
MLGSTVLDVAIGLAFIYLSLALVCTTVTEWLSSVLRLRGKMLEKAIFSLLDGIPGKSEKNPDSLVAKFYNHPLIKKLKRDGRHPSYISARDFSRAVIDILSPDAGSNVHPVATLQKSIDKLEPSDFSRAISALLKDGANNIGDAQARIETWFNDSMDRVSGFYKRNAQAIAFGTAVVVTLFANADTIAIANRLWREPAVRAQEVGLAQQAAKASSVEELLPSVEYKDGDNPIASPPISIKQIPAIAQSTSTELLGWSNAGDQDVSFKTIGGHLFGWVLSAFAVALGAPFWFDTLNRFINLRAAGQKPKVEAPAQPAVAGTAAAAAAAAAVPPFPAPPAAPAQGGRI